MSSASWRSTSAPTARCWPRAAASRRGRERSRSGISDRGTLVRSLDALHSDTVFGVRFSPDGTKLATAAADKFLKVAQVADGKELKSFEGHTHHVLAVDWKSDGKQLVTGGADNVLKVWDFETGEQLRTLQPAGKQVTAGALGPRQTPSGRRLGRQDSSGSGTQRTAG